MKVIKKCSICDSTNKVCFTPIGLLCGKHYSQWKRYGEIKERTRYDSNEIRNNNDNTSSIILYNIKAQPIAEAIVDTEKVSSISNMKWCLDKNGYVKNSKQEYLHRIIMQESNLYIDHIDGNPLNNTKANLRACSNADNLKNRVTIPSNNTSGVLGVRFRPERNKWTAEIRADKVTHRLGHFNTKEEAIEARLNAELEYFGEYKSKVNNYEVNRN